MGIDANIALSGRPTVQLMNPNEVMNMKRLAQQNRLADEEFESAQNVKSAYRNGTTVGADGKVSYNQGAIMSELAKGGSPEKAMEAQKQFSAMDSDKRKLATEQALELAGQANPENWGMVKQRAKDIGYQYADTIPDVYSKDYHDKWRMGAMNAKDQLSFEQKDREIAFNQASKAEDRGFKQQELAFNQSDKLRGRDIEMQKLAVEKTKATGEKTKRSVDDKKMGSYVTEGLRGIGGMSSALEKGDNTFSLIGDNDFTRSLNQMAENFGRMQSGGAINKDEEARFKKMAPGIADNKDIQNKKLAAMDLMFRERAQTYGVDLDAAGLNAATKIEKQDVTNLAPQSPGTIRMRGRDGTVKDVPAGMVGEAIASGASKI